MRAFLQTGIQSQFLYHFIGIYDKIVPPRIREIVHGVDVSISFIAPQAIPPGRFVRRSAGRGDPFSRPGRNFLWKHLRGIFLRRLRPARFVPWRILSRSNTGWAKAA